MIMVVMVVHQDQMNMASSLDLSRTGTDLTKSDSRNP
jgi:hypothetical protein